MRILYLTPEGFNTPNPNNQMVMVLARQLLSYGNDVHIIQSRKTNSFPDIPEMLENKDKLVVETIDRKNINKSSFIKRYLNEFKWAFQSYKRCKKLKKKTDVVIVQSCPTAVFELVLLKLFFKKPIVFNVYDLWPGNLIESGITKNRLMVWLLKRLQKIAYHCCKKILVLSQDMKDMLVKERVKETKIEIVPAWYDDQNVFEINKQDNRFLQKFPQKEGQFIVQFAGSIGYVFNYDIVLRTALALQDKKDIVFQIVGDGLFKDEFIEKAKEMNISNLSFYPLQPIEMVPDVYSACNVEIIPLRKAVIGVGVPSKAPLVMACKRVIINSLEDSPYYRLFGENNIGISVPFDDSQALADSILFLYKNPDVYREMANNAQKYARDNFSSTACTLTINKLLAQLTENG